MTRRTQRLLKKLVPYLLVLVLGGLVVFGVYLFTEPEKTIPTDPTDPSESETEPDFSGFDEVSAIDVANVTRLIDRYYDAKIADDADTLNDLVKSETEYNVDDLLSASQYIARYDRFKTYVIPGPTEKFFIVYVKYEIYFKGIKTGAPALNHFLVEKTSEGTYKIYDRELSSEFRKFIEETEAKAPVVALKTQVEKELDKACRSNEDLKLLMELLNSDETEAPETKESSTEETSSAEEESGSSSED